MNIFALFLLVAVVCKTHAWTKPLPLIDEPAKAYVDRYGSWVDSIPQTHKAWDDLVQLATETDQRLSGFELTTDVESEFYEDSLRFVARHIDLVDQVAESSQRPYLGMPSSEMRADENGPETAIDILLPHLSLLRTHSQLLVLAAIHSSSEGNAEDSLKYLTAITSLSAYSITSGVMIEVLVQCAIQNLVLNAILDNQVELASWDDNELSQLENLLVNFVRPADFTNAVTQEHWCIRDAVSWIYKGHTDGRISVKGTERFIDLASMLESLQDKMDGNNESLDELKNTAIYLRTKLGTFDQQNEFIDNYFETAILEFSLSPVQLRSFAAESDLEDSLKNASNIFQFAPAQILIPSMSRFYQKRINQETWKSAVIMLVAIERYHKKFGSYPQSNDELVKHMDSELPIDPFSDTPLKYALVDGLYMIYSTGPDRDDDEGRALLDSCNDVVLDPEFIPLNELKDIAKSNPEKIDGDWILYPLVTE
jgi:hypothetical protein